MDYMNILLKSTKNLLGKKSTQDILKYLAGVLINYACNKFNIYPYKYDPMDIRNMVYHYNVKNRGEEIDVKELDKSISLFSIDRIINEICQQEKDDSKDKMKNFIYDFAKLSNDGKIIETYNNMNDKNHILKCFDNDTLETSSIADSCEINSGNIYIPDRTIILCTPEGKFLADAKNEYLEKRIDLGNDVKYEEIEKLIKDFYEKIEQNKVKDYFNI